MSSKINDIMIRPSSVGRGIKGNKSMNSSFDDTRSMRSVNSDFNKSYSGIRKEHLEDRRRNPSVNKGDLKAKKEQLLKKELQALIDEKKKRNEYQ